MPLQEVAVTEVAVMEVGVMAVVIMAAHISVVAAIAVDISAAAGTSEVVGVTPSTT